MTTYKIIKRRTEDGTEFRCGNDTWTSELFSATHYSADLARRIADEYNVTPHDYATSRATLVDCDERKHAGGPFELATTQENIWHVCDKHWASIAAFSSEFEARRAMRTLQGLPTCHDFLVDEGVYVWRHSEEDAGDEGDGESGPMPWYTPTFDQYDGDVETLIFQDGVLVYRELIDWDQHRFFEQMERDNAALYAP